MNDSEQHSPLIQRLAVERMTAPGVVDRTPSVDRVEKLNASARKHPVAEQLIRRAQPSVDSPASSLVWQASLEQRTAIAEPVLAARVQSSAAAAAMPVVTVQRSASLPPPALQAPITRRELPSSRAESSRAVVTSPVDEQTSAPKSAPMISAAAPLSMSRARSATSPPTGSPTIMRQASESTAPARLRAATRMPVSSAPPSNLRAAMQGAHVVSTAPLISKTEPTEKSNGIAREVAAVTASSTISQFDTPSMTLTEPARTTIARKVAANASTVTPASHASQSVVEGVSRSISAPLIMRTMSNPNANPGASPGANPNAIVPARASDQIKNEETPQASFSPPSGSSQPQAEVDRIVEQVEQRLAERLTIERERRGLRRWR